MKKTASIDSLYLDKNGTLHVSIVLKTGNKHTQMKKHFESMRSYNDYMLELGKHWTLEY